MSAHARMAARVSRQAPLRQARLSLAQQIAHPFSLAISPGYGLVLHLDRGEPELLCSGSSAVEALAPSSGLGFVREPQLLRGAALIAQGAPARRRRRLCEGLASLGAALALPVARPSG